MNDSDGPKTKQSTFDALDALEQPGAFDGLTAETLGSVSARLSALARQTLDKQSAVDTAALATELDVAQRRSDPMQG